jgi:GH24 family phage-related lysozyme (muramidase)
MENRFLEMDQYYESLPRQRGCNGSGLQPYGVTGLAASSLGVAASLPWARTFAAADRALVILIENGGVDLGIPELVDVLLKAIPGSSLLPNTLRQQLIQGIRNKLKSITDDLLESAELAANRYTAAKPDQFGDVIVLRDGTASYQDLKSKLIDLSRNGKIVDVFILTHGSENYVSVAGGIDGQKIRDMKAEYGQPLSIRSVYMMNCVGSSLNQAWLDAGARTSCGTAGNNYLPEPTMFFFWQNWKSGQTFENAATSAYRKTVNLMKDTIQGLLSILPGGGTLGGLVDFENMDFVISSAPRIVGKSSVTINSDNLSFSQSISSSLTTTVLPDGFLQQMTDADAGTPSAKTAMAISKNGIDLIKSFEGFVANPYNAPEGNCTVGYGTLLHLGKCDGRASEQPYAGGISEEKATQLLADEATRAAKVINDNVKVALNQNQFNALASFVYNVGSGSFTSSTLLKVLNKGDYNAVPAELKRWTKANQNGKMIDLPGLVKRRAAEADLFQKAPVAGSQSLSVFPISHSYTWESESSVMYPPTPLSRAQNPAPAVIAGIAVADAAQIGLGAAAVVQSQVAASQGSLPTKLGRPCPEHRLLNRAICVICSTSALTGSMRPMPTL